MQKIFRIVIFIIFVFNFYTYLEAKPKLIVIIVVDQIRYDYLPTFEKYFTAYGFNKFTQNGINFTNCKFDYIGTVTCAGHATISTGSNPSEHGIIGNAWWEGKYFACTDFDDSEGNWKLTPQSLMLSTLGDELKKHHVNSKVFSISGKDRASIMMGGKLSDGTFWIDYSKGQFRTSDYFNNSLPTWLASINNQSPFDKYFNLPWERSLPESYYLYEDFSPFEASPIGIGNTFPRILNGGNPKEITSRFYSSIALTPYAGEVILDVSISCIENEKLGIDSDPDILWIGLSNIDAIGHAYGPESQEIQDAFIKTDSLLAAFISKIEDRIGKNNVLFILTGDHGVAPVPEKIQDKVDAGRFNSKTFVDRLNAHLRSKFGLLKNNSKYVEASLEPNLYLNINEIEDAELELPLILEELKLLAKEHKEIEYFLTNDELTIMSDDKNIKKFNNNFILGKSGQIMYGLKPFYIFRSDSTGSTHGSLHDYDTHVPFALYGLDLNSKVITESCSPADIAPTLAELLNIELPGKRSGKSLIELIK
jgi:predicted AlkP superfamily pyrophosphatase or phosphodiesterase